MCRVTGALRELGLEGAITAAHRQMVGEAAQHQVGDVFVRDAVPRPDPELAHTGTAGGRSPVPGADV